MATRTQAQTPPTRHHFTVAEYGRMGEAGIFGEDDRVELIAGEIVDMSPINPRHASCVKRFNRHLNRSVGDAAIIGVQDPIQLDDHSAPQPDLAVLRPRDDAYARSHPTPGDVLLVIEVSDTTLAYDRGVKLALYAAAGIAESWIANLVDRRLERYTEPRDGAYRRVDYAQRGETLASTVLPDLVLPVDTLLG